MTGSKSLLDTWEEDLKLSATQRDFCLLLHEKFQPRQMAAAANEAAPRQTAKHLTTQISGPELLNNTVAETKSFDLQNSDSVNATIIENSQQFLKWFANIEVEMEREQEASYREQLDAIGLYLEAVDGLCRLVEDSLSVCKEMEQDYDFVQVKSSALQNDCERLLAEQQGLLATADQLAENLAYFNDLEKIIKLFNAPGNDVCTNEFFAPMLARLDECISFVQQNPRYKDAELYQMRFRQCMTRGLSLIKLHVTTVVGNLAAEVQTQLFAAKTADGVIPSTAISNLLYIKFKVIAQQLRPLVLELESRCEKHTEYYSLLNDCHAGYLTARSDLLAPIVTSHIRKLFEMNSNNLLAFARVGSAYVLQIYRDEYRLFCDYFDYGDEEVIAYMEGLSGSFYDYLLPLVVKETSIDVLCDLHAIIRTTFSDHGTEIGFSESILARSTQDIEARLVFRAQSYIRTELESFEPKIEDLNYPKRLKALRLKVPVTGLLPSPETADSPQQETPASNGALSPVATESPGDYSNYVNWFPTLSRTLYLLSKLYRTVNDSIFQELSQEATHHCLQAIKKSHDIIRTKAGRVDGMLFYIKHLLALREETTAFSAEFSQIQSFLDFSKLTDTLNGIILTRSISGSILGLMQNSVPKLVEQKLDAKFEIDTELKSICEELIVEVSKAITEPISSFLIKAAAFRMHGVQQKIPLRDQAFADKEIILEIFTSLITCIQERWPSYLRKITDYIPDSKTRDVITTPIKNSIMQSYRQFYVIIESEYPVDLKARLAPPMQISEKLVG